MSYANMIKEENLKKTFIIATLVSTLIGTFTSSLGLYERLAQKKEQKHVDKGQDTEIKQLRDEIKSMRDKPPQKQIEDRDRSRSRSPPRRRKSLPPPRDELEYSLERGGDVIRRQYDEGYARLGQRFAVGDTMTENQLQQQVIMLQQTVIKVLQDALYNNRTPDRIDISMLHQASETARANSIDALRNQYQRMLQGAPIQGGSIQGVPLDSRSLQGVPNDSRSQRAPSQKALTHAPSVASSRRSSPSPPPADNGPLFCPYAQDLQRTRQPLHPTFKAGDSRCPACRSGLGLDPNDIWKIVKENKVRLKEPGFEREVTEERAFHLLDRFIVKCHRPDGEYACFLCTKNRKVDTVCANIETLVRHVGRVHETEEYEREVDIREFG